MSEFISYSNQKKASLGTVDSDLSDKLVETLLEEGFAHRTDAVVTGLGLFEALIHKVF